MKGHARKRAAPKRPAPAVELVPISSLEAQSVLALIANHAIPHDVSPRAVRSVTAKLELIVAAKTPEPARCTRCTHTVDEHCREDLSCEGGLIPNGCLCPQFEEEGPCSDDS
jgi:hypothetical protein